MINNNVDSVVQHQIYILVSNEIRTQTKNEDKAFVHTPLDPRPLPHLTYLIYLVKYVKSQIYTQGHHHYICFDQCDIDYIGYDFNS